MAAAALCRSSIEWQTNKAAATYRATMPGRRSHAIASGWSASLPQQISVIGLCRSNLVQQTNKQQQQITWTVTRQVCCHSRNYTQKCHCISAEILDIVTIRYSTEVNDAQPTKPPTSISKTRRFAVTAATDCRSVNVCKRTKQQ